MEGFHTIQYKKSKGVALIVISRPGAFNAFTEQMNKELIRAMKMASKDEEIRVIGITGEGKAFCAGEDLGGIDENTNHESFLRKRYHPMMKAIKVTPKPIVALVNGTAAGAGMSLALAADFRLVKENAKFVSAFINIGLIPDSAFIYYLPRIVGYAKAMEISLLSEPITGQKAFDLGLATEVYQDHEWDEKTEAFLTRIAALPTKAVSLVKRYMVDGMNNSFEEVLNKEAQAQRIAGATKDHIEGLSAFKNKRKPAFSGK
ncbi:enoyl-CoA hydratase/isomerase family protein [Halobacillus rhizosphaerae]|uniref:enoyl-CoA hydratase/isomerase family protein n=1 Tax=Halobacillus rhizosphaerae TaxID=3064889 RepID=UPI00398BB344